MCCHARREVARSMTGIAGEWEMLLIEGAGQVLRDVKDCISRKLSGRGSAL
jgi:hypothetical protein